MTKSNVFDRLLDSVAFIEHKTNNNCRFLICGDFNSRTSVNPDFVEEDGSVHMSVLLDEYIPDNQLPRFSEDVGHVNNNGLLLLDFCKQTGMRIMNGRVGSDYGVGRYTFVGSRGSSLVDYALSSQDLFNYVKSFIIQELNILSDHCMIRFCLEFHSDTIRGAESEEYGFVDGKYNWKSDFKTEYVQAFQQQETTEKLNILNQKILNCSRNDDVNSCISDFTNLIGDISTPIFRPTPMQNSSEQI